MKEKSCMTYCRTLNASENAIRMSVVSSVRSTFLDCNVSERLDFFRFSCCITRASFTMIAFTSCSIFGSVLFHALKCTKLKQMLINIFNCHQQRIWSRNICICKCFYAYPCTWSIGGVTFSGASAGWGVSVAETLSGCL